MAKNDDTEDGKGGPSLSRRLFMRFAGGSVAATALPAAPALSNAQKITILIQEVVPWGGISGLVSTIGDVTVLKPLETPEAITSPLQWSHRIEDQIGELCGQVRLGERSLPMLQALSEQFGDMPVEEFLTEIKKQVSLVSGDGSAKSVADLWQDVDFHNIRKFAAEHGYQNIGQFAQNTIANTTTAIQRDTSILSSLSDAQLARSAPDGTMRLMGKTYPRLLERLHPDKDIKALTTQHRELMDAYYNARNMFSSRLKQLANEMKPEQYEALTKEINKHVASALERGESGGTVGRRVKLMLDKKREFVQQGSSRAFDERYFNTPPRQLNTLHAQNVPQAEGEQKTDWAEGEEEKRPVARAASNQFFTVHQAEDEQRGVKTLKRFVITPDKGARREPLEKALAWMLKDPMTDLPETMRATTLIIESIGKRVERNDIAVLTDSPHAIEALTARVRQQQASQQRQS